MATDMQKTNIVFKCLFALWSITRETDYAELPHAYTFVDNIESFCDELLDHIANQQSSGVEAKVDAYPDAYMPLLLLAAAPVLAAMLRNLCQGVQVRHETILRPQTVVVEKYTIK